MIPRKDALKTNGHCFVAQSLMQFGQSHVFAQLLSKHTKFISYYFCIVVFITYVMGRRSVEYMIANYYLEQYFYKNSARACRIILRESNILKNFPSYGVSE